MVKPKINKTANKLTKNRNNDQVMAHSKPSRNQLSQLTVKKPEINSVPKPQNFLNDALNVGKTALDVVKTGSKIIQEPLDLETWTESVPKSIAKVVDTVNTLLPDGTAQNKIVLEGKVDGRKGEALMNKIKDEALVVNTSSVPTSFASTFEKPNISEIHAGINVNGMKTSVMSNMAHIVDVTFPAAASGITSSYRTPLLAFGTYGTRINNFVINFDRFRLRKLVYSYIPTCPTGTNGSVHLMFRRSPKDFTTTGTVAISDASQLECYTEGSVYSRQDLVIPCESEFLYCTDLTGTESMKWFANGFFCCGTSGNNSAGFTAKLGSLYVTATVECYGAIPSNFFPSLLPNAAITRIIVCSIGQEYGMFKSEDLRHLFGITKRIVQIGIDTLQEVDYSSWDKILELFIEKKEKIIEPINNEFTRQYFAGMMDKLYQSTIRLAEDIHCQTLSQNDSYWDLTQKSYALDKKKKKIKITSQKACALTTDGVAMAQKITQFLRQFCFTCIDASENVSLRVKNLIKNFISELLNWQIIGERYNFWTTMMSQYTLDANLNLLHGDYSIGRFLTLILNELHQMYSLDEELKSFFKEFEDTNVDNLMTTDIQTVISEFLRPDLKTDELVSFEKVLRDKKNKLRKDITEGENPYGKILKNSFLIRMGMLFDKIKTSPKPQSDMIDSFLKNNDTSTPFTIVDNDYIKVHEPFIIGPVKKDKFF